MTQIFKLKQNRNRLFKSVDQFFNISCSLINQLFLEGLCVRVGTSKFGTLFGMTNILQSSFEQHEFVVLYWV